MLVFIEVKTGDKQMKNVQILCVYNSTMQLGFTGCQLALTGSVTSFLHGIFSAYKTCIAWLGRVSVKHG